MNIKELGAKLEDFEAAIFPGTDVLRIWNTDELEKLQRSEVCSCPERLAFLGNMEAQVRTPSEIFRIIITALSY